MRSAVKLAVLLVVMGVVVLLVASTGRAEASGWRAADGAREFQTHCDGTTPDAGTEPCPTPTPTPSPSPLEVALSEPDRDRLDRLAIILAGGLTALLFGVYVGAARVTKA